MKLSRISVGVLMAVLVVVAIDCAIYRSVNNRPHDAGLTPILFGTLPMANLLAIGLAWLVSGRARHHRFLVGFEVIGWCLLFTSIFWREPVMNLIAEAFYAVGFTSLFGCSFIYTVVDVEVSIGDWIAAYSFVIVVPFLLQVLVGLAVGAIASRFGRTPQLSPEPAQSSGRLPIRSMVVLIVLVAIPAVVVEAILRWRVDAPIVRLAEGSEALIAVIDPWEVSGAIPPDSPILVLDKAKVRIEEDRAPSEIEGLKDGWIDAIRDYRTVKVKILDGPKAGESDYMIYYMLRPIR